MRHIAVAIGVVVLLSLAAGPALAGFIPPGQQPDFQLRVNQHGHGPPEHIHPPGHQIAPGLSRFHFQGNRSRANRWLVEWDLQVDPDPLVTGIITVTNLSPAAQTFTLSSILPIGAPITGGTLTGGSISGTLVDTGGGAELSSPPGGSPPSLYTALIDDVEFQTLLDAPQSITAPAFETTTFGPETFGGPVPSLLGPDANDTISIDYNFRLSGGDAVSLTGTFVVVPIPEPSTIVLLCMGGLGLLAYAWRRRVTG